VLEGRGPEGEFARTTRQSVAKPPSRADLERSSSSPAKRQAAQKVGWGDGELGAERKAWDERGGEGEGGGGVGRERERERKKRGEEVVIE
jgi:hypothetical protein